MNVDLKIIDPLSHKKWNEKIIKCKDYSIFHTSEWAAVLNETYGYKPNYLTSQSENGFDILIPLMEVYSPITGKRGVSLPFTDYCNPIIRDETNLANVFDQILFYGNERKWKYIELRGSDYAFENIGHFSKYFQHVIDLTRGENNSFSSFNENTKRNIKKAYSKNVKIEISKSLRSLRKYYDLHCLTRKKHGLPPQPFKFFSNIHANFIDRGLGIIILAFYENIAIAGNIFLHFGKKAFYKFGASDIRFLSLRPNNLVMWEGICWYIQNNFTSLCLGRTDYDDEGLRRYKRGWGSVESELIYFRYDIKNKQFLSEQARFKNISTKIFQNMPIPVLKIAGSILYKHMG